MHNNIEIKAKIRNVEDTVTRVAKMSDTAKVVIEQHDTFFETKEGRLKLREFKNKDGTAELILYERPNILGPKLSNYDKLTLSPDIVQPMRNILRRSNGILGVVEKKRFLYIVGQTRIHIDTVKDLGNFIELEVMLRKDQDVETGQKIANDLMHALSIKQDDLIAEAYIDLLNKL